MASLESVLLAGEWDKGMESRIDSKVRNRNSRGNFRICRTVRYDNAHSSWVWLKRGCLAMVQIQYMHQRLAQFCYNERAGRATRKKGSEQPVKIAFYTLGCKVNQYETQALREQFQQRGYQVVGDEDHADVYVINTCTVTGLSDRKSRQYIRRVKRINPESVTAVIGCYAQVSPGEALAIEGVDIVAGNNDKAYLIQHVEEYLRTGSKSSHVTRYEDLNTYEDTGAITSMDTRTRAYLKIQEGCNQFCSYCIIPYARGGVRSRKLSKILEEARQLIDHGVRELVLTGINVALYGTEPEYAMDPEEQKVLGEACKVAGKGNLESIRGIEVVICALNALPGSFRIRLSSLEPTVINADYAEGLLAYDRLCHSMHLSLQHGSDRILADMNRHYRQADYLELVQRLRNHDPGYGISTDLIVGYPGETQEDFDETLKVVKAVGFCKSHVFKYSRRVGTKAAERKDQIHPDVKSQRSTTLQEIAGQAASEFFHQQLGTLRTVLLEERKEETGLCEGFTDNYIKVTCPGGPELVHQFVQVRLTEVKEEGMIGIIDHPSC